ncbi:hypothetical protein DCAR_0311731 [Daucus carota subsp. sativus]|uniref:AB hydrolase-1 domain-containing protein n=1 Tax=Daucus carota subsp. sativus TaxID=79200 RepID=A0AAF1ATH1_DAUCS|nr:hypothetical protein DCAR_0311731 [Daucus carota subsp. sativus]
MFVKLAVAVVGGLLGCIYVVSKRPPSKVCGSPGGPHITSPRVRLADGRHLAYKEVGELIEELQIYILSFDRAGYGESDPYPKRSVKSEAYDIQQLADNLQIGPKFYVIGISMGAYPVWSCLKYIPHRLSGASLVVPFVHYWWPCFPASLSKEALIAHYAPWLFNWWMTQKWFPFLSINEDNMAIFSEPDLEILKNALETPSTDQEKIVQQGEYESLHREVMVGYANWEGQLTPLIFIFLKLYIFYYNEDPFPNNEGSVHIWQGLEDKVIPYSLNRYLSQKLPWI